MQATTLLNTILKNTYTTEDLNERMALLREFLEEQFFSGGAKQLADFFAKRGVEPDHQKAMLSWDQKFYRMFNQGNLYQNLTQLSKVANGLPKITLETAGNLDDDQDEKEKLAQWLRRNVNPHTLIKLKTNPQIIGGVRISYGSRYGDYSLRKRLEKNRNLLREILDKVNE